MFRLPLTPFEQYLWHEDQRGYPCWIFIRFTLRGVLRHGEFERAWAETARRHPLLAAVVRRGALGGLRWEPAPQGPLPVVWLKGIPGSGWPAEWLPLDLRATAGFRVVVAEADDAAEIYFQIHHVVTDGGGLFAVFHDLMLAYARECGQAVDLPELRPEMLRGRGRLAPTLWDRLRWLPSHAFGLALAFSLMRREVAPLLPHSPAAADAPPPTIYPAVASHYFAETELQALRVAAKRQGVALNELLMRDLFAAVGAWRSAEGAGAATDWIRIGVPVSLRRAADRFLSAANVIGIVGIDRRARSLANRERLLRRAHEDMEMVKRHRLAHALPLLLALRRCWFGGIRGYARRPGCSATLVMTNLGQFFSLRSPLLDKRQRLTVPGAVLEDVLMIAPFRPGTVATLALGLYAGRMRADLSYDARFLTAAQAENFMQTFERQVRLSTESAGTGG